MKQGQFGPCLFRDTNDFYISDFPKLPTISGNNHNWKGGSGKLDPSFPISSVDGFNSFQRLGMADLSVDTGPMPGIISRCL
jgi:hypothetical protein